MEPPQPPQPPSLRAILYKTTSLLKRGDGSIRFRVVGALLGIIVLFLGGFTVAIYGLKKDTPTIRAIVKVLPYPIAIVNFSSVTLKDYYFTQDFTQHFYTASKLAYDPNNTNKQIVDQLIDQELVVQHARKEKVTVASAEVDQAYQKLVDKSGKDEVSKVLSDLYGLSETKFRSLIYYQVLKQKLEATLKDKGAWHQVQVRHLLIKVDQNADQKTVDEAKKKAEDNLNKIKDGKSFAEMAKANSEDTESKDQGGELGYVSRGQTVKEFEDAVFGAKKGDLVGPIRTQYGWHIMVIEDVRGGNDYQSWREQATIHRFIRL